jgi:quinoprotein relay system zinc metallohydrolase 2
MFEAVITVCLMATDGPCRDQLVPGYEAQTLELCAAALTERPPEIDLVPELEAKAVPFCKAAGESLAVTEVAPGIFVHMGDVAEPDMLNRGDATNLGFVLGETSIAVVDTGTARWMGEALWRAIRLRSNLPVSHVILTHMHPDHVLGAAAFSGTGAEVVGHADLPRALADRQANYVESLERLIGAEHFIGTRTVPVDMTVSGDTMIDLGNRLLHLRSWPMAHTGTDVTVLDERTKTLFAGDLVFHLHTPALDGSLRGWRAALEDLAALEVERVIPGHGGPSLDWPAGGAGIARYLQVLEQDTRTALDRGLRLGEAVKVVAQSEAANWQVFDAYNARNATVAFTELEWE